MKFKKLSSTILAFAIFIPCVSSTVSAAYEVQTIPMSEFYSNLDDRDYIPLSTIENVTVDGDGSEWGKFPAIRPVKSTRSEVSAEVNGKVAWDEKNFYLYVEVKDDVFISQGGGTYWQADSIQIAMGLPEESFGDEIGLSFDMKTNESYLALPAGFQDKYKDTEYIVVRKGNITYYEMSIAWTVPFEEKPDMFKFDLIVNDEDGGGRNVIYMEPGIHDAKYNTYFPTLILISDEVSGFAWVDGEISLATREKHEYFVNVLNLGEAKKQKVSVPGLGFEQELDLAAESWTRVKVIYDTGDVPGVVEMNPNTEGTFMDFPKTVKIHPTIEIYQDRLNAISEKLAEIDELIAKCGEMGIATDYEEVNANTVREFLDYVVEDVNNKDADRVEYQLTEMEKLNEQAYTSLENYILGTELPYDVPRYFQSGPLKIENGVFNGWTRTTSGIEEERPVFLIGYGHGNYSRRNATKFPGVGGNYMQMEMGPNEYVRKAGPVPDWLGGYEGMIKEDETGNHYAHVTGSFKQGLPVKPKTKYRLTFEAYGENGSECWLSFEDWNNRHGLNLTKEKKTYTYEATAPTPGVFTLHFFIKGGEMFLDNLKISQLDENGNEVPYDDIIIKNPDFEKMEHDSIFYCDFSPVLGGFADIQSYGEVDMLVSFNVAPHYFPNWIYVDYEGTKKASVRPWDYNSEVMQDFFYEIGHELARVLKNLDAVNDMCVHNEDRHPLYMDEAYLPFFRSWLEKHYNGDINALNYNYGTDYKSFEEVPMPNGLERNSQTWDLALCTDENVTVGRRYILEGIKSVWPEVTVHGKLMSETIFNTSINRFTQGMEPVSQGRLFGVHGMDGGAVYTSGMFVDNKFYEGSPFSVFMSYDYLTSDLQAPILNTEDHIDGDGDVTVNTDIGDHCARYMWEACVHGRCSSAIWIWDRTMVGAGGERGHVNYRPDQMAKIGRTALDANRLSKEITALVNTDRTVQILYSPPTRNRDYLNISTIQKVYDACVYSGQKPYILTDNLYDNINHADILIVPVARYATEKLLKDLLDYVNSGKTLVLIGDFCLEQNEYAKMHDKSLVEQIYAKSIVIPVEYEMDTSYSYVGVNSEAFVGDSSHIIPDEYDIREMLIPVFEQHNLMDVEIVDVETGERVEGVKFIYTDYDGKKLVDVSYFGEYGVTKRYKILYKGQEIPEMRELRSGRLIKDSIVELDASMPQLLQFDLQ